MREETGVERAREYLHRRVEQLKSGKQKSVTLLLYGSLINRAEKEYDGIEFVRGTLRSDGKYLVILRLK